MRPADDVADEIVSAANIVTCGGYYECDPIAVTAIIEADRKQVREEVAREVCEWLRAQDEFSDLACRLASNCEMPDVDLSWTLPFVADEIERKFLGENA